MAKRTHAPSDVEEKNTEERDEKGRFTSDDDENDEVTAVDDEDEDLDRSNRSTGDRAMNERSQQGGGNTGSTGNTSATPKKKK